MALPAYASLEDRLWHHGARLVCYAVLLFLVLGGTAVYLQAAVRQ